MVINTIDLSPLYGSVPYAFSRWFVISLVLFLHQSVISVFLQTRVISSKLIPIVTIPKYCTVVRTKITGYLLPPNQIHKKESYPLANMRPPENFVQTTEFSVSFLLLQPSHLLLPLPLRADLQVHRPHQLIRYPKLLLRHRVLPMPLIPPRRRLLDVGLLDVRLHVILSCRLDLPRAERTLLRLLARMRLLMPREVLLASETLVAHLSVRLLLVAHMTVRRLAVVHDAASFGNVAVGESATGAVCEELEARKLDDAGAAFGGAGCGCGG